MAPTLLGSATAFPSLVPQGGQLLPGDLNTPGRFSLPPSFTVDPSELESVSCQNPDLRHGNGSHVNIASYTYFHLMGRILQGNVNIYIFTTCITHFSTSFMLEHVITFHVIHVRIFVVKCIYIYVYVTTYILLKATDLQQTRIFKPPKPLPGRFAPCSLGSSLGKDALLGGMKAASA